jgi:hypothetical protein
MNKERFKNTINILAWCAIILIGIGFTARNTFCLDVTCGSVLATALIPLGFLILCINSFSKKDYPVAIVLIVLLSMSVGDLLNKYEKYKNPPVPPPAPVLNR